MFGGNVLNIRGIAKLHIQAFCCKVKTFHIGHNDVRKYFLNF